MRHQPLLWLSILTWFLLMGALAWSPASAADPPASVSQLIIAMDGWGSDLIDPWEFAQPGFIADYLNLRLLTRDENMKVQPLWAVEWSQNDQGIEPLQHTSTYPVTSLLPPHKEIQIIRKRRDSLKSKTAQKPMPKLPGKHTCREKMVDCLLFLFTKRTMIWM